MSEFINKNSNSATIRRKLLTNASAIALLGYLGGSAQAADADRPSIWIELDGQLSRLDDGVELFAPSLMDARPSIFAPSQKFDKPPRYAIDEHGEISFRPEDSAWTIAASIRIGRSISDRHVRQQTYPISKTFPSNFTPAPLVPHAARFADTKSRNSEQHAIVDFQAGRDVGMGMFGNNEATSTFSVGVRFAQFSNKSNIALKSDPDWRFQRKVVHLFYTFTYFPQPYHSNAADFGAERGFHGVGPSLSWNASVPLAGNQQHGELSLDWGLNGALLFGRQKTRTQHQTTSLYHSGGTFISMAFFGGHGGTVVASHNAPAPSIRSRTVIVPNIGGSASVSFNYNDAKVSFGYRADLFFHAMDGGIDKRKSENVGFYGPFASISIGVGG